MTTQAFTFEQLVNAPASRVYHAFTNATALREWMCDVATLVPRHGGRLYMAWNSGFYMTGEFTGLESEEKIAFTWNGRGEPGPTQVEVLLSKKGDDTLVRLSHDQVGTGPEWANTTKEIQDGWKESLENLASVLSSGEDLRITMRPMLGITVGDLDAALASKLGVPVTEGVRLESVVAGMGAQAAGLQSNDVLVDVAGREITGFPSLTNALQGRRAGEHVEVIYYRGSQKMTVDMELSRRQIPAIPATLQGLAEAVKERCAAQAVGLDQFFANVTEAEASFKPADDEWSTKEVLAHLIQGERAWQNHVAELVGSQESWTDDYGGNLQAWIQATVTAYPTLLELLEQLKRHYIETTALFADLPAEFREHKGAYWRLSYEALEPPYHLNTHLVQMQAAINAAREK